MARSLPLDLDPAVRAFVADALARIKPELDARYCREHGIRFDNHEIHAGPVINLTDDIMRRAVEKSFDGRLPLE